MTGWFAVLARSCRDRELCACGRAGKIVLFDNAYLDFADLARRGVFWVTRAKDNLRCRVVRKPGPISSVQFSTDLESGFAGDSVALSGLEILLTINPGRCPGLSSIGLAALRNQRQSAVGVVAFHAFF